MPDDPAQILAGIKFLNSPTGNMAAIWRNKSFGDVLRQPEFVGVEQLKAAIEDKMDTVREIPVFAHTPEGAQIPLEEWKAIQSGQSGKVHAIPSWQYVPVQDKDIAVPLYRECVARQLHPVGSLHGQGTGKTSGHILIADKDYTIELLKEYEDDVMLGVRWWNSFDTETSFGADVFGIRTACGNYQVYGKILGEFRFRHTNKAHDSNWVQSKYEELLKHALDQSSVLRGKVEQAIATEIHMSDYEDLLWGLKVPITGIQALSGETGLHEYVPDWAKYDKYARHTTAWTVFNAVTAFVTYRINGGRFQTATHEHARNATRLLLQSHDSLIEKGRKARQKHEEAQLAKEKLKQKVKA